MALTDLTFLVNSLSQCCQCRLVSCIQCNDGQWVLTAVRSAVPCFVKSIQPLTEQGIIVRRAQIKDNTALQTHDGQVRRNQ